MAEVSREAAQVWSHKARIVQFLSDMRHFYDALAAQYPLGAHELKSWSVYLTSAMRDSPRLIVITMWIHINITLRHHNGFVSCKACQYTHANSFVREVRNK